MQRAPFQLSTTQKIQVTLLYHFASLDYLKGLQQRLHTLMASVNPALDLAKLQQRDAILTDARWGNRNTSENWGNNAWPLLADFELSVATHIAKRAYESYSITGANQCARGLAEMSLNWMTPDEQSDFENQFEDISLYAGNIDDTMNQSESSGRWDDCSLMLKRQEFPAALKRAPALRLRADITGRTGMVPVRTGVYLPLDDPHGTPQFCWTGQPAGGLLASNTFNSLGLDALAAVGRNSLWIDEDRMHAFVQHHLNDPRLTQDPLFSRSTSKAKLAPSLIGRNAFTTRPCTWIYVEQIHGELEEWAEDNNKQIPTVGLRIVAGTSCDQPGYYFTPAKDNSRRYFSKGEVIPDLGGDYGVTIWQWDENQE